MKTKTVLNLIQDAEYEDFGNAYKKLLGYERNTEFFAPHADSNSLVEYINNKLGYKVDEAYAIFMRDSNGCELDGSTIFSFKHEEQAKDVLFVNFDKSTRKQLHVNEGAFIAGKYQSCIIVYDKASNILGDKSEGYIWGIYSLKHEKFISNFYDFLEVVKFLIQDLIDYFVEEN